MSLICVQIKFLVTMCGETDGEIILKGELAAGHGTDFCRQKSTLLGEVPKSSSLPSLIVHKSGSTKILPFEFRALEVCLESACKRLESEVYPSNCHSWTIFR